jgi:hypothetical protein
MDDEERFRLHEETIQALARLWKRQGECNAAQRECNQRVTLAIERIDHSIARIDLTLQAIKDMLGRGNGRP